MARGSDFVQEVLPGRRIKVTVGAISLVFTGDARKVRVERRESASRRGTTWLDDRDYHAAADLARRHFQSLRPAARKESLAAQKADRQRFHRVIAVLLGEPKERGKPSGQFRPASHVVAQQARLNFASA
jgi:hypothetical protein